jgi:phosphoribosylglycinamide formyltransferase-1
MTDGQRPVLAIFASGSGTTFQAVADAVHDGLVAFSIGLVITDREQAGVLDKVADVNRRYGMDIKTAIINKKRYPEGPQGRGQTIGEAHAMLAALEEHRIDHICLMGCLRIIAKQVIDEWGWRPEYAGQDPAHGGLRLARMSNTHPGIFPETVDTFGLRTQQKVLDMGLRETAHTLHVVAAGVDEGPIIAEHRVPVYAPAHYHSELADTPAQLFARVQRIEKAYLPLDLDAFLRSIKG